MKTLAILLPPLLALSSYALGGVESYRHGDNRDDYIIQQERSLATLQEKWNLTSNGFSYDGLSFSLDYITSDFILDDMMQAELYDTGCKEGGNIIPSSELNFTLIKDVTEPGVGDLQQQASIKIDINPATITDSMTYSEEVVGGTQTATVQFCMRMGLFTNSDPPLEVNFLETIVTLDIDLTDGFTIDTINVTPKDELIRTANQAYEVEGYLCDINNIELSTSDKSSVRNQGSILRVCVRPDEDARSQGVYMRYIESFTWQRDYGGVIGIMYQPAIEEREAASNRLTELFCVSGAEVCAFETILFASMFRSPGMVAGSGVASMQFGSDPLVNQRRGLGSLRRSLQQDVDVAATAEFEMETEVFPVANPFLDKYRDSSSSSAIQYRFWISAAMLAVMRLLC
jgi:hypothetical protein